MGMHIIKKVSSYFHISIMYCYAYCGQSTEVSQYVCIIRIWAAVEGIGAIYCPTVHSTLREAENCSLNPYISQGHLESREM